MKTITTFAAGYNVEGVVFVVKTDCIICKEVSPCICIDNSDSEYRIGTVCLHCAKEYLKGLK